MRAETIIYVSSAEGVEPDGGGGEVGGGRGRKRRQRKWRSSRRWTRGRSRRKEPKRLLLFTVTMEKAHHPHPENPPPPSQNVLIAAELSFGGESETVTNSNRAGGENPGRQDQTAALVSSDHKSRSEWECDRAAQ